MRRNVGIRRRIAYKTHTHKDGTRGYKYTIHTATSVNVRQICDGFKCALFTEKGKKVMWICAQKCDTLHIAGDLHQLH